MRGVPEVQRGGRLKEGTPTHDIARIRATYDAIKERVPDLIVNLSSAVGMGKTPEQRIAQIVAIKPEMASLNTNSMNFAGANRKTGEILVDYIFDNTFATIQNFARAMRENGVKPEIEVYDIGGLDNILLLMKQGIFSDPMNFNFVWGVAGGQTFRPEVFVAMVNALPDKANFTTCGVGREEFSCIMQSCMLGGHMRVGLEDNVRAPNGDLVKGSYELVEWAVRVGQILGREPATPNEARAIMGLRGCDKQEQR